MQHKPAATLQTVHRLPEAFAPSECACEHCKLLLLGLRHLKPACTLLLCCTGDRGTPLAFCIGGPFGHGDEVRARSNEIIRLSNMVLNHQASSRGR